MASLSLQLLGISLSSKNGFLDVPLALYVHGIWRNSRFISFNYQMFDGIFYNQIQLLIKIKEVHFLEINIHPMVYSLG